VPARQSTALPVTCSAAHGRRGLLGLLRWVSGGSKPHPSCPGPHLSLYRALCDRGPSTSGLLSVPDQDTVKGSDWPLGQLVEIKLTFSLLISPYDLNLTYLLYLVPIPSQISA